MFSCTARDALDIGIVALILNPGIDLLLLTRASSCSSTHAGQEAGMLHILTLEV